MIKRWTALLGALLFSSTLGAQEMNLTVDQAMEMALLNNLSLLSGEITLEDKKQAWEDRWNVLIPDVNLSATLNRSNEAPTSKGQVVAGTVPGAMPGSYDQVMIQNYDVELSPWALVGNLEAQLALNPAMVQGAEILGINYRLAQLDQLSQEQKIALSVEKTFYQLLLMEGQVELMERNISTMEQRLKDMEALYNNGLIPQLDLLQTRAGLAQLKPSLTSLNNNRELLKMNFRMMLGMDLDQDFSLEGDLAPDLQEWSEEELVQDQMYSRLDIQQLELNQELLTTNILATRNQKRMPSMVFSWKYNPMLMDPFESEQWESSDNWTDNGSFSITLMIPLDDYLPHSSTSNQLEQQRNQLRSLQLQKEQALQGAEMEIRQLVMNLESRQQTIAALDESLDLAQTSFNMSLEAYNNGQKTLTDLEAAETDLFQAELNLLAEQFNYISAQLDLEYAVQMDF